MNKDAVCIIDCTEAQIQKPNDIQTRSKTWLNYKHVHTVKFLIGTNPSGAVNFTSECWGGRYLDK